MADLLRQMLCCLLSKAVPVGIWYILRAQRGSHIPTLKPKYIPYNYMDPFGLDSSLVEGSGFNPLTPMLTWIPPI